MSAVPLAAGTASGSHPLVGFIGKRTMEVRSNDIDSSCAIDMKATSLPSPALQRFKATCA